MNIIPVSHAEKQYQKDVRKHGKHAFIYAQAMLGAVFFTALGAAATLWLVNPERTLHDKVKALQTELGDQQQYIDQLQRQSQQSIDHLAVKVGQLEAKSIRLDAIGSRLAKNQQISDGEFDFASAPAVGGLDRGGDSYHLPKYLDVQLDMLDQRFNRQQAELKALRGMLSDKRAYLAMTPMGEPVANGYISSPFGYRTDPFTGKRRFHSGMDIAVKTGARVKAVADGLVTFAGKRVGYGNVVDVDHGGGYKTRYAHNAKVVVAKGDIVHVEDTLARAGSTGRSTGPHVHFEVWQNGKVVNPRTYLEARR